MSLFYKLFVLGLVGNMRGLFLHAKAIALLWKSLQKLIWDDMATNPLVVKFLLH